MSAPPEEDLRAATIRVLEDPLFTVDTDHPVESDPACTTCGLCCVVPGYRGISPPELWNIVDFLGCDLETMQRAYLRRDVPNSLRAPCAFLSRSEAGQYQCGIYPVRPDVCRGFSACTVLQRRPADAAAQIEAARARWAPYVDAVPKDELTG